ncbi:hypothetical protein PHMEG_00024948 [Phytophthora megakarya]|uniref:Reverse transcriptase/retrotransposon-derived protein RNase H-like domain-containing protein n=1 Tax=Phytophthora megakarya TaxID=4795 RepID=A0A225VEW2_9STRA|nr:hypothetical protein PHMEG_00024948 [Phytophthora megakarya]
MPKQAGYVPIDSRKYEQWQGLAYAGSHDETWFKLECKLYERWLASQPPLVERQLYTWPTSILQKLDEYSSDGDGSLSQEEQWSMELVARSVDSATDGSPVCDDPVSAAVALGASTPTPTECLDIDCGCNNSLTETHNEENSPDVAVADLEHTFMCVMPVMSTEGNDDPADGDYAVHEANYISLEDYAQELVFLPDLTELSVTELDYTAPNVRNPSFVGDQKRRLDEVLKKHEAIMISGGYAFPPPAYGVVCDIDVQGTAEGGLIAFSDSPWVSPIVIVLKKNDQDIRLCIDYKMVNAITAIMEYTMSLVGDLLTELENYLWFCSLDATSGFWAIMMTMRPKGGWERYAEQMKLVEEAAKHQRLLDDDSDFILTTTRTKFEADRQASSGLDPVLRMVNDPYIDMLATSEPDESSLVPVFQRRSFVDDISFGGTTFDDCLDTQDKFLARFEECRISVSFTKSIFCQSKVDFLSHEVSPEGIRANPKKMTLNTKLQRKVADAPILRHFDVKKEVHIMLYANEWALSATLMQMHDDKLHPVRFCGRVLKDAAINYHSAEKEVLALLLLLKVYVYTRFSTLGWVHKSKSLFGRAVQFAVLLLPWQLEERRVREKDCVFTQLLQSTITNFVDLDDSLALVTPPTKGSPSTRLNTSLLYAQLPHNYEGVVVSFDGSAKAEKNGGYGSCS